MNEPQIKVGDLIEFPDQEVAGTVLDVIENSEGRMSGLLVALSDGTVAFIAMNAADFTRERVH